MKRDVLRMLPLRRLFLGTAVAALLAAPSLALAAGMSSSRFQLDGIAFSSTLALVSSNDGVPPVISSDGPTVTDLEPGQVTIVWKTDKVASSVVDYGETAAYGQQNGKTDLVADHTVTLYGLVSNTTYHYQVTSVGADGLKGRSADLTFATPAEVGITSISISDVSYDQALVSWSTGNFSLSTLEYGTTTAYGKSKSSASRSFTTDHTMQITGLTPGTGYHVRIVAQDEKGNVSRSSDFTFTTLPEPAFTKVAAELVSPNVVKITWATNTITSGIVKVAQDGQAASQSVGSDRAVTHVTQVEHLVGKTKYTFSIVATDAQGHEVASPSQSFTTAADTTPPVMSGLKVDVANSSGLLVLTVTWKTDEPSTSEATLVPKSGGQPIALTAQDGLTLDHTMAKSDLLPSAAYELDAVSKDAFGNTQKQTISFVSPAVHKSIFSLLADSILQAFGWVGRIGR